MDLGIKCVLIISNFFYFCLLRLLKWQTLLYSFQEVDALVLEGTLEVLTLCFPALPVLDPGWDRWAWHQNLPASRCGLWRGRRVQGADESPQGEGRCPPHLYFSDFYFHCFSLFVILLQGKYSLRCDRLQPADRGEGEEDPRSSVPMGSRRSRESWTQWLP